MNLRLIFSILFALLSCSLAACAGVAFRSEKEIGKPLGIMLLCIIPPVIGNFLIIMSTSKLPATIGCYMYYIGIDFTVLSALLYALAYCKRSWPSPAVRTGVLALVCIDVIQLLANTVFGHAFGIETIQLYGKVYYRMVPYLPQNLHRLLVYSILATVVAILFVRMRHSSRIHARRYGVILYSLVAVILWCTFYVVSRTPLDRSMIGYAVFGLLAFYFSLFYKPTRLMNRILLDISAELPDAMFFFDDTGACIWMNREGRELLDMKRHDPSGAQEKLKPFMDCGEGDNWTADKTVDTPQGRRYYELESRTIRDRRGYVDGSFLNIRDDTQAQLEIQREAYRSRHDELTDLYNRQYLYRRIQEMMDAAEPDQEFRLVFLNVSNFKLINDIFGNAFGDEVLKQIAQLIRTHVPKTCLYGRLVSDTFGVFLPVGAMTAPQVESILSNFSVSNGEIEYRVLVHLGIYEVNDHNQEISIMFDRARIAASSVRDNYHTHIAYYDEKMRSDMLWEQQITSELPQALKERQIIPYLQPMVDTRGKVVGAEALVRWKHPRHGFLSPASFIPVFERNGMIAEIDRYMWRCACEMLASWPNRKLFISINISPKDFYFTDVVAELRGLVKEYGVDPSRLRIEITESVMISDVDNKLKLLNVLRQDGFIVEMDDFGSGYSSLNMLKNMPIDVIKIDMAFLGRSEDDEKPQKILRNIINMLTDLEIVPLTEGVEKKAQYETLSEMGCKLFQGYYFARPMPSEEFEERYISA